MKNKKDEVLIIGSGIGGLSCGSYLARKGYKVKIFERLNKPGGYVNTFKRNDYIFENTTHLIGIDKYLLKVLGLNLELIKTLDTGIGYYIFNQNNNIEKQYYFNPKNDAIDTIVKYFPSEKDIIEKLFKYIKLYVKDVVRLNNLLKFPFVNLIDLITAIFLTIGKDNSIFRRIGINSYKYFNKIFLGKSTDLVENIKDPVLASIILMIPCCCFFTPPDQIPAIMTTSLIYYLINSASWIKGGTSTIINNMINVIKKNNGQLQYNANVAEIIVKNKTAIGIRLTNGEEYFGKYIVTDINCFQVYNELIKENYYFSEKLSNKLINYKEGSSAFQTYVGLPFELKDYGYEGHTNIFYTTTDLLNIFKKQPDLYNPNFFITTNYSSVDSSYSPKGTSSMVISTKTESEYWLSLDDKEYYEKKQKVQNSLLEKAQAITNIPFNKAELIFSATPRTLKRYSGNPYGSIIGLSLDGNMNNRFDFNSEIKNLYHVGADTRIDGGFYGALSSGVMAGKTICIF